MKREKSSLEFACMEMNSYQHRRVKLLPEAFLRPAYKYTIAEVQDHTQEDMHEYDYRGGL